MAGLNAVASDMFGGKIRNRVLLDAFGQVDRAQFLDSSIRPHAGANSPLPIGHEQTTSQPFVIARMLEMMLKNGLPKAVLEVGAGCGYQTALLSVLCERVYAVERIGALARKAAERLRKMGYRNAQVVHGDGFQGHAVAAPYDAIIICAEHLAVPEKLLQQLTPDGVLVMPLKTGGGVRLVSVNAGGEVTSRRETVSFVPMVSGKH